MSAIATAEMQAKMKAAREALDAHVREIIEWHFNPETGTPFWLERAKNLDFDPRKDIQTYEDLDRFGFFQDEWRRGGPSDAGSRKGWKANRFTPSKPAAARACPNRASHQ